MDYRIDLQALRNNLKKAELPTNADIREQLKNESEGMAYLFETVILPMLAGVQVNSEELDMERFDLQDVGDMDVFYEEKISPDRRELDPLRKISRAMLQTAPKRAAIRFI